MSSDPQSIAQGLFTNNCLSLAMVTVVVYDYVLMFPNEIEYVWNKPWTWISTMYILVRYLGIYSAVGFSLMGTIFLPGPVTLYLDFLDNLADADPCTGLKYLYTLNWSFQFCFFAADLVMIMRVYAMWSRSRIILGVLLLFYVEKVVTQLALTVLYNTSSYTQMTTIQVFDYSVCNPILTLNTFTEFGVINSFVFDLLLFVLALVPTAKQLYSIYQTTKKWQPNRYMILITRQGLFYIFLNSLNNIANVVERVTTNPLTTAWLVVLGLLSVVTLYPMIPRFILSIRAVYEQDRRGRCQGVDTGFGVSRGMDVGDYSAIAFAESRNEEDKVEIELGGADGGQ